MEAYIAQNRAAYDQLACEYEERVDHSIDFSRNYLLPFYSYLDKVEKTKKYALDIGCGAGYHMKLLAEKDYDTTGIDISGEMIKVSQRTSPATKFVQANFLDIDLPANHYDAVVAVESIHNYTKSDAIKALEKIYTLLNETGYLLLTTNTTEESKEGFFSKKDYQNKIERYRKFWTDDELKEVITDAGFIIKEVFYVRENELDKDHINIIACKAPLHS